MDSPPVHAWTGCPNHPACTVACAGRPVGTTSLVLKWLLCMFQQSDYLLPLDVTRVEQLFPLLCVCAGRSVSCTPGLPRCPSQGRASSGGPDMEQLRSRQACYQRPRHRQVHAAILDCQATAWFGAPPCPRPYETNMPYTDIQRMQEQEENAVNAAVLAVGKTAVAVPAVVLGPLATAAASAFVTESLLLSSASKLLLGLVRWPARSLMNETNMAYSEVQKLQEQEDRALNAVGPALGMAAVASPAVLLGPLTTAAASAIVN